MAGRLTHRKKADPQFRVMPAQGRTFTLSGKTAALLGGWKLTVPDAIPYEATWQEGSARVGATSTFSQEFVLAATSAQTAAPFAFGHAFAEGDIPAGQVPLCATATDWQARVLTTWPVDGSAKHAIIAGRANVVNGDTTLTLTAGSDAGGATLTEAYLSSVLPGTTIAAGAFSWNLNTSVGTSDLQRTVCSGPVMSNFIYRKPVSGSNHLVLWADVRLYKGGNVEIFPWVENAYLLVANPTNDVRDYSVVIGGVTKFSQASLDIKHHTRIPLISGTSFSYWTNAAGQDTDPGITPKHDTAYLMATKLVPNYGYAGPSEATLAGLTTSYTPNYMGGYTANMASAGGSGSIVPAEQAFYIKSGGDPRAYRCAIARGLSGGSWSTHYRENRSNGNTNEVPRFSDGASLSLQDSSIPAGTGGEWLVPKVTHEPSYGYLPFLITGRWWFWEESAFWSIYNHFSANTSQRRGADYGNTNYFSATAAAGIFDPCNGSYSNRGAHWAMCMLGQTLTLCPSTHSTYADWKTSWETNTAFFKAKFVDGTHSPGWVSPQGKLGGYARYTDASNWTAIHYGEGFEDNYGPAVLGFTSEIGVPQSAQSLSDHTTVRNHAYKQVTSRSGDGVGSNYNWRRFAIFDYPIGVAQSSTPSSGVYPASWYTPAESFAAYNAGYGLSSSPTGGLKNHRTDTDCTAGTPTAATYLPAALGALAYAVDHGAVGASDGWLRVTGASNFSALSSDWASGYDAVKSGFVPRTGVGIPAWVPAPGARANVSMNTISSVYDTAQPHPKQRGSEKILSAWCSTVYAKDYGTYGSILSFGGGHADYLGSEVYRYDIESRLWSRIADTYPAIASATQDSLSPSACDTTYYEFWTDESRTTVATDKLCPPHNYGHLAYVPASVAGNGSGWLFHVANFGRQTHYIDLDNPAQGWKRLGPLLTTTGKTELPGYGCTVIDVSRSRAVVFPRNNGAQQYAYVVSLPGGSLSTVPSNYPDVYYNLSRHMAADDVYVLMNVNASGLKVFDPVSNTLYAPATSGTVTSGAGTWDWIEATRKIVYWPGTGSTIYFLQAPSNPRTGTWAWLSQDISGDAVATAEPQGGGATNPLYNRLHYVETLNTLFHVGRTTGPVQAWKL